jgi:CubicO group peptidase (beta-lactamase class C family)
MKELILYFLLLAGSPMCAQNSYFPPITNAYWATLSLEEAGFCSTNEEALYDYLAETNTDAFLLLKDGKIVIEKYFGDFTAASPNAWFSAGKSLMAFAVGVAKDLDFLDINDRTADYLGAGWTDCPETEDSIRVIHQLTMTSGLSDAAGDTNCNAPECLVCLAAPGTRWAYHTGAYTLLGEVIEAATSQDLNDFIAESIKRPTGMTGQYRYFGDNRIFISNARSMARFGLLMLNGGTWDGTAILRDTNYFQAMTTPSQDLNKSYGYLWWLNGQVSYRVPSLQLDFPGLFMPNAPAETYAAIGKNGQLINIVPSQGLVMVRMGATPGDESLVSSNYNDAVWAKINDLNCTTATTSVGTGNELTIFPNPSMSEVRLSAPAGLSWVTIYDNSGRNLDRFRLSGLVADLNLEGLPKGVLHLRIVTRRGDVLWRKVVKR